MQVNCDKKTLSKNYGRLKGPLNLQYIPISHQLTLVSITFTNSLRAYSKDFFNNAHSRQAQKRKPLTGSGAYCF